MVTIKSGTTLDKNIHLRNMKDGKFYIVISGELENTLIYKCPSSDIFVKLENGNYTLVEEYKYSLVNEVDVEITYFRK